MFVSKMYMCLFYSAAIQLLRITPKEQTIVQGHSVQARMFLKTLPGQGCGSDLKAMSKCSSLLTDSSQSLLPSNLSSHWSQNTPQQKPGHITALLASSQRSLLLFSWKSNIFSRTCKAWPQEVEDGGNQEWRPWLCIQMPVPSITKWGNWCQQS